MCKNCYEKFIERSKKTMLVCRLKENEDVSGEMATLCLCQRYCSDEDKYIPWNQKVNCKNYED